MERSKRKKTGERAEQSIVQTGLHLVPHTLIGTKILRNQFFNRGWNERADGVELYIIKPIKKDFK